MRKTLRALSRSILALVLALSTCMPASGFASGGRDDAGSPAAASQEVHPSSDAGAPDSEAADVEATSTDGKPDEPGDGNVAAGGGRAESSEGGADAPDAKAREQRLEGSPRAISEDWSCGRARIEKGGSYVLDRDVKASEPLVVALPAEAAAVVDLAGFSAEVDDAPCAIDLSSNAGEVTFVDSGYDASRLAPPRSAVTLKAADPSEGVAAVFAVRSGSSGKGNAKARFEGVRLAVDASVASVESLGASATAIKTGDETAEGRGSADARVSLFLADCVLDVKSNVAEGSDALHAEQEPAFAAKRGSVSAIDAACRGVTLGGRLAVKTELDGSDEPDATRPALLSRSAASYSASDDLAIVRAADFKEAQDDEEHSGLVVGFPSESRESGAVEAEVVIAGKDARVPSGAAGLMRAEAGYALEPVPASSGGSSALKLVKAAEPELADPLPSAQQESVEPVASGDSDDSASDAGGTAVREDAQEVAEDSHAGFVSAQAAGTNLNAAWKDTSNAFTISAGGTYYLSRDLAADGRIVVNAANADVVIELNGHTLELTGGGSSTERSLVTIEAARSVLIDGSGASGSAIRNTDDMTVYGVSSTADECSVKMREVAVEIAGDAVSRRVLHTHCVHMAAGNLLMDGCELAMDMGNQALRNTSVITCSEPPSALYASSSVASVRLENCAVRGIGTSAFSLSDIADTTSLGNAYAVYSLAASTVVQGGSYKAESAMGNATCLYGSSLEVVGGGTSALTLEANASQLATGILSTEAGSVSLEAPFAFAVGEGFEGAALAAAALRSTVPAAPGGFVFGSCAPEDGAYSALVMEGSDLSDSNVSGWQLGVSTGLLSGSDFVNALGSDAPCDVAVSVSTRGVGFVLDGSRAVARIGSTLYSTVGEAAAALADGETLTLLRDAGPIEISTAGHATVDLNGKAIASLRYSHDGSGEGLVVANGTVCSTVDVGTITAAVYQGSSAPLFLEGVTIRVQARDKNVCGVYGARATGAISIDSTSVIDVTGLLVSEASKSAYGVFTATRGPQLVLDGAKVAVRSPSAGMTAYGVFSSNGAELTRAAVSAEGSTGATYALYLGGALSAADCSLDVRTSGVASIAAGVGLRAFTPKASKLELDGCSIDVQSASSDVSALSNASYACILGATEWSGMELSGVDVSLSGACAFSCVGDAHIGLNLGPISLGSDFSATSMLNGAPSSIVVSQTQAAGNVGFTVESGSATNALARAFTALHGSYYEAWNLSPDAGRLVWLPGGNAANVLVESTGATFSTLADALASASEGDTVKVLNSFTEPAVQAVDKDSLTIDLNGKELTLRGEGAAKADSSEAGAVVQYSGAEGGVFAIADGAGGGKLTLEVGEATELAVGGVYQGLSVLGGGALVVGEDATVEVDYTGSSLPAAVQYDTVSMRGVMVANGSFELKGNLVVNGALANGSLGALSTYGIVSRSGAGSAADITVARGAQVDVTNGTGVKTTVNSIYPETFNAHPTALRELKIDPVDDADFYEDINAQFRKSASYDDPDDTSLRVSYGTRIYFAAPLTVKHSGKWYDGLSVYAFTDEVASGAVGKMASLVPTHFFVDSSYETPPKAYGVATLASSAGAADVSIEGSVSARCPYGNAYAIHAQCEKGAAVSWSCAGAALAATASESAHLIRKDDFDLRDFIDFAHSSPSSDVTYVSDMSVGYAAFEAAAARDAVIGDNLKSFVFSGVNAFKASACDAANVEAAMFEVADDFGVSSSGDSSCSVADPSGAHAQGAIFAKGTCDPALFVDAYRTFTAGAVSGGLAWAGKANHTVAFKVGDAVVARYANVSSIDLSGLSSRAQRADDLRQSRRLVGWSLKPDENATGGYVDKNATIEPTGDCVYYAVYETVFRAVDVTFSNIVEGGAPRADLTISATYGQKIGEALAANGNVALPEPGEYGVSENLAYRFVGWCPASSSTSAAVLYSSDQVAELAVTMELDGVQSTGALELRAVYLPVAASQHVVTFVVDGYTSACVVETGKRPSYLAANNTYASYVNPSKQTSETGKSYTFSGWRDQDGNSYRYVLPSVTADATYTAQWAWRYSDVSLTFFYTGFDKDRKQFYANDEGSRIIETTYDASIQEAADSVAKVGSKVGYGGKVYTLLGWSPRQSDIDPVYDAANPIPALSASERSYNYSFYTSYYGIYQTADHMVTVKFVDGSTVIGRATVNAQKSVNNTFSASGAKQPADKSAKKKFLGWAVTAGASEALDGTTVTIDSLVDATDDALTLHAVFGDPSIYTVRLRSSDGKKILYSVSVKSGKTVNQVLAAAKKTITVSAETGKYFWGWSTAAGKYYSLDSAVTGSADLYATYKDIKVTSDSTALGAVVSSVLPSLQNASSVTFSIVKRAGSESGLQLAVKKSSYVGLGSYTMKLTATYSDGTQKVVTGDIGSIALTAAVGTKYKNTTVRAFWIGTEDGGQVIKVSGAKKVNAKGVVSVAVGTYVLGDEDEGGNLTFAYLEGGTGSGSLSNGSASGGSTLNGASGALLAPSTLGGLLGASSGTLAGSLSGSLSKTSGLSQSAGSSASSGSAISGGSDGGGSAEGADGQGGGVAEEEAQGMTGDWSSDAVVLFVLAGLALAAVVYGLWRLIVVGQRRRESEAEIEFPKMEDKYAEGLNF